MNTLDLIFDWLLQASLRASLLTVAVLLIQRMLRRYLSARWQYALWLPVLIVLLMPVLPESRWSVASVFTFDVPTINLPPVSVVADAMPTAMPAPSVMPVEATKPVDWHHVRVVTWVVGVFLVLLTGMVSFTRTLTRVRRTREPISDELAARIDEVTQEVGLKQKPRLFMSPRIQSPAVTGLLRPLLLLPTGFDRDFTAEEQSLIVHHELMHLRRGDLPLNTLLCVLMALHWFNPLLWLAFFKVRADREAACDAQVLENATPQLRSAYGHALLKIESAFAPLRLSLGFIGILQRHASLRSRIRSIAAQTRTRPLTSIVAATFMLVMTFLGVTRAEKPAEYENARQIYLTAHFIEISGKANEADGADKVLAEALADFPASQREKKQLQIVLDDPQNQAFVRKLSQQKGVDLMTTPSVSTRSGQKASIEVAREFTPPGKKPLEKKVGVMLDLLPTLTKVDEIELTLNPRIVEFEGFKKNAQGEDEPVFSDRQADASLTLKPGQTVLLDLGSRSDTQEVKDITDGKTTISTDHFTRRAIVLVTAQIIRAKKAEKASVDDQKAVPAKITADQTTFDEKTSIGRYTGHAKLEAQNGKKQVITATSDEIIYHQREHFIIVKAPLELKMGKSRITSEEKGAEARIDLKTGQLQTHGRFRTIMLSEEANSPAEAQAAKLRAAKPQQYDFSKAILGDVIRYLARDAGIRFISLPDDQPLSRKAVTFSLRSSPFGVLETICRAHGLIMHLEQDVWHIRAASGLEPGSLPKEPEPSKTTNDSAEGGQITKKLQSIVFPRVQFHEATLEEAIEFFRAKARMLDTTESDVSKRGVNILMKDSFAGKITLDLKEVPLMEALKYTASLAGLEIQIEDNAVILLKSSANSAAKPKPVTQGKAVELAKKYILPQVQFSKATLEEALEFLRLRVQGRDDAQKADINLILKPGGNAKTQISLNLKDVSLWEALSFIAELSNHTLSADDHSIILTPR